MSFDHSSQPDGQPRDADSLGRRRVLQATGSIAIVGLAGCGAGGGGSPTPTGEPFGLDCGGEELEKTASIDGLEFTTLPADNVNTTGVSTFTTEESIDETDHDWLYQTEHYGPGLGYEISVPQGTYDVILHFAEIFHDSEGLRVFDVSVQGETLVSEYDIYAEVGANTTTTETAEAVSVEEGGVIEISSTTETDNTKFSGIEIRPTA